MIILCAIIFCMIFIIVLQYKSLRKIKNDLIYIRDKLNKIDLEKTEEKILLFSDDKQIKGLLNEINKILIHSREISARHRKIEISMKKMLSNISHDLKTPLTVILGYLETMKLNKDIDTEKREVMLSKAHRKTEELTVLINKFFDLAKLEAGDKKLPISRVNMSEICRKNILNYYDILMKDEIEVNISIPETDIYAHGNEEAINRILSNLISNAVKYGREGKTLGLKLYFDEKYVYTEVFDKGCGIDEINKGRVFERMYTLEDSRNKYYKGSGLGLTITKRLIEKLGGNIELYSKPYEKTSFIFSLPK
ncbi:sensor histidine kinase [Clostridium felsineum]|uniref:histidine kinase n=2 Tax=Clostridium felsineum TaxID=36839 RepID=A0A1S8LZ26_9CLOT|nr:sensor histidine kinase [Clostridium felsineum]URZ07276.1 Adaptive-response sensory-kinase SasA [Clostridium felsineum]URZ12307.1 Adaptive-response sensory-kinase SasA [Clostridium felsineum]